MDVLSGTAMNFELTEEQKAVRDAARDFAQNVLKPGVIERDRNSASPRMRSGSWASSASWA